VVTHLVDGLKLTVDRGPNWLFVKLRPRRNSTDELSQIADELWSIASRHFIYRLVLELEELKSLPPGLMEQLTLLQDKLAECDGALRICGLSAKCAQALCDAGLDAALPNHPTRDAAIHGDSVVQLHEKVKQALSGAASKN
jgi:anti-sigma B factor antagonist